LKVNLERVMSEKIVKKKPKPPVPPKGNQYALGNAGGRPQEYDRVKIAHDLIEWAKKPDSLNLNKFCAYNDPIISPHAMLRWCREDPEFRTAYDKAKTFLGFRREEMLNSGELHVKAFDLNATVYDAFNRAEKIEMDDMVSARKQKELVTATQQDVQRAEDIVKQLDKLQSFFSGEESSETSP
jgi:hypothetical protein